MEYLGENYPSSPYFLAYTSRPGLTLVTVGTQTFLETPVNINDEKSGKEPEILKCLSFDLHGLTQKGEEH